MLIEAVCENHQRYNEHCRRLLLTGIYELADSAAEAIAEMKDANFEHGRAEIELMREAAEKGLKAGDIGEAFKEIHHCCQRAISLPGDTIIED
jgi:hypothetical protein